MEENGTTPPTLYGTHYLLAVVRTESIVEVIIVLDELLYCASTEELVRDQ
jgi:hypothetical protein